MLTRTRFCCKQMEDADWEILEPDYDFDEVRAFVGYDRDLTPEEHAKAFKGMRFFKSEDYSYSEYTAGIERTPFGDPIKFCPWCGKTEIITWYRG